VLCLSCSNVATNSVTLILIAAACLAAKLTPYSDILEGERRIRHQRGEEARILYGFGLLVRANVPDSCLAPTAAKLQSCYFKLIVITASHAGPQSSASNLDGFCFWNPAAPLQPLVWCGAALYGNILAETRASLCKGLSSVVGSRTGLQNGCVFDYLYLPREADTAKRIPLSWGFAGL
jgi:hypothetical protein